MENKFPYLDSSLYNLINSFEKAITFSLSSGFDDTINTVYH